MCGILVSKAGRGNDKFIRRRGQDGHGHHERNGMVFEHFLLNVTGPPMLQPFIHGDIVCLYNGEIYNHPYVDSDGENLIRLYREHGILFPRQLDGEFAIALYDFAADLALFITDRFATKPLWRHGIECASYESGVGGHKIAANTIEVVRLSDGVLIETIRYHEWDWRQIKTDYADCVRAFEAAVAKRYKPGCFIGLSSGYDSGAIACALRGREFKAYAVLASENLEVVWLRDKLLDNVQIIDEFDIAAQERHLRDKAEEFNYRIRYDDCMGTTSYKSDYAARALSHICMLAHMEGRKVCLSGGGADEILSDYSLIPRQSEFKGTFPDELREWSNFVGSCQYSYINKEEYVGGSWAIETRYPFLDHHFVQEFLWLTPELKNRRYKSVLHEYMVREQFPFDAGVKIGWTV